MSQPVPDVHSEKPLSALKINKVGIKGVKLPPVRVSGYWAIPAISAYVDLSEQYRGAHISRLYKVVYEVFSEHGQLDYELLDSIASRLLGLHEGSSEADVSFTARIIGNVGGQEFRGGRRLTARLLRKVSGERVLYSGVSFLVVTACPCALEVSKHLYSKPYTHNAIMCVSVILKSRQSVPHPFELLKCYEQVFMEPSNYLNRVREAEFVKRITEQPRFSEDVAREAVQVALANYSGLLGSEGVVYVRVTSIEPLHEYRISVSISASTVKT